MKHVDCTYVHSFVEITKHNVNTHVKQAMILHQAKKSEYKKREL